MKVVTVPGVLLTDVQGFVPGPMMTPPSLVLPPESGEPDPPELLLVPPELLPLPPELLPEPPELLPVPPELLELEAPSWSIIDPSVRDPGPPSPEPAPPEPADEQALAPRNARHTTECATEARVFVADGTVWSLPVFEGGARTTSARGQARQLVLRTERKFALGHLADFRASTLVGDDLQELLAERVAFLAEVKPDVIELLELERLVLP